MFGPTKQPFWADPCSQSVLAYALTFIDNQRPERSRHALAVVLPSSCVRARSSGLIVCSMAMALSASLGVLSLQSPLTI